MSQSSIPAVAEWLQSCFHLFLKGFLRRHFHAIAIDRQSRFDLSADPDVPLIVYGNHPSWWDPLIAHYTNRQLFPGRQFYAPIDADALEQYRIFKKLGFYGVKLQHARGAGDFLGQSTAIMHAGKTALWMTPEGHFADARDHSRELMPGLAHLCKRSPRGWAVPFALEYVFWDERLPVCLTRMGAPIDLEAYPDHSKSQWNDLLVGRLRCTQRDLATQAIARCSEPFDNLLPGARGAGLLYDTARRIAARISGRQVATQHGKQFE